MDKGKVDEAIDCWRKAIVLDPKNANAHGALGVAQAGKGQWDEAIACYRKAIELDPKHAETYYNLGSALHGKGKVDEAIECFHKAIELDPKHAKAHANLVLALHGTGKVEEAIDCYLKAIALDSKQPPRPTGNLGYAKEKPGPLRRVPGGCGRARRRRWDRSSPAGPTPRSSGFARRSNWPPWRPSYPRSSKESSSQGTTGSRSGLIAAVCQGKKLHHATTRLFADTFAADSNLADDPQTGHRYNAACAAAQASAGQGEDAGKLECQGPGLSGKARPSTG